MSLINGIIPAQAYEAIRDRIGVILHAELDNQVVLTGDYDLDADVYVERIVPMDAEEEPVINVSLANGDYDSKEQGSVRATYLFNVDVYVKAKSNSTGGDIRANLKLQKLLGKCRAILENPVYKTLDFTAPHVYSTLAQSIAIRAQDPNDALSSAMGRIVYKVVTNETTELLDTTVLGEHWTSWKLYLTDKGYQYKLIE